MNHENGLSYVIQQMERPRGAVVGQRLVAGAEDVYSTFSDPCHALHLMGHG